MYRYRPKPNRDLALIEAIQDIAKAPPGWGLPKIFKILRRRGYPFNHNRVHRGYCELFLNQRRRAIPSRWRCLWQPIIAGLWTS